MCSQYCYNGNSQNKSSFHPLSLDNLNKAFDPYTPTYSKENSQFVEVDIEKTFIEKLQAAGITI